jgi:glycosyltransferase involved in cell wall biosynthesis
MRYRAQLPSAPIVQGHKLESTAMLHWLFPRARVVSFIHSQAGALAAPGSDSTWRGLGDAQVLGERALTRRAASVVVFNPSYAEELSTINPHVHAAATWFDPAVVRPGVHDPFALVWVGRLEPPKDPLLALAVFRVLAEGHPSEGWRLTMIGEGSLRAQVVAMIASWPPAIRDRVRFMGALSPEDAAREVGDSGILLMTSVPGYEGFPRVLVEGLASGLPAVVTHGTDTGNLVREGLTGRTCGRDPSELAAAVREVRALDRDAIRATVSGLDGSRMVPELFAVTRADAEVGV